ncbi:MatE efflux protein [Chloropicon roscoffensis]|uniref:Protein DETOXIFICATION n=1 Tax=Chloropicon roscoffensis TaxID=1461544 RepID=A0AAX4P0L4_9CHLO
MTTIAAQASARRTERAAASTSAGPGVGQAWPTRPTPWSPVRGSGAPKAARNRVPGVLVLKRGHGPLLRRARAGGTSGGKGSVSVKNEKKTKEKDFLPEDQSSLSINDSIITIALPAFFALAADPIASLVDSAWIGRIGAIPLTASGLAIAVLNIVVKLFNSPLLSVTTSVIAKAYVSPKRDLSKASSIAIELGILAGGAQTVLLFVGAPFLIHLMGVDSVSDHDLYETAVSFLRVRALGAPANVLLLTTQGIFRGLGDTKRPFYATLAGNVLNWATVVCEYISALYLLYVVYEKIPGFRIGSSVLQSGEAFAGPAKQLLSTSGVLALRSLCVVGTYATASSLSLEAGEELSAAHQVSHQLWQGSTLLADALAVAAQTLMAQSITREDEEAVLEIVKKVCGLGLVLGTVTALLIQASSGILPGLFSDDQSVLSGIDFLLPFVVLTQPITALAFVLDGVLYGGSDFNFAAKCMFVSAASATSVMALGVNFFAESDYDVLTSIWVGNTVLMSMRLLAISYRMQQKGAPFRKYLIGD